MASSPRLPADAPDVKAVLATPTGHVLVDPDAMRERADGDGRVGARWGALRGAVTGSVLPAVGSAVGTAAGAAGSVGTAAESALGWARGSLLPDASTTGDRAGSTLAGVRESAGGAAAQLWERARSSETARDLASRSDLVASVVGRPRRRRWPVLLGGAVVGLAGGIAVARRRRRAGEAPGSVGVPPAASTTSPAGASTPSGAPSSAARPEGAPARPDAGSTGGPTATGDLVPSPPATGAPVAPGHPATTLDVGGSVAEHPLGQQLSGGVDPVFDGGPSAMSGPAAPAARADADAPTVTELPAATSATEDGELHSEP